METAPEQTSAPTLRTEGLRYAVGTQCIVNDINLDVWPGDIVAVVGPSGAGKSSLLRLLNRLEEPTSGTVWLNGQNYRDIPPRDLRRWVGMLMQSAYLFPGTVADNIRFGPRQRGEEISDTAIDQLLAQVELPDYAVRDTNRLSGGEAQRVSLARTLANSPRILLLDEPTSALDETAERSVEKLLCSIIREQNLACLIITHDKAQAARIANRVLLMENGRLVKLGSVAEVLDA
jgi:putative ABC transport system ATP-binding protein